MENNGLKKNGLQSMVYNEYIIIIIYKSQTWVTKHRSQIVGYKSKDKMIGQIA